MALLCTVAILGVGVLRALLPSTLAWCRPVASMAGGYRLAARRIHADSRAVTTRAALIDGPWDVLVAPPVPPLNVDSDALLRDIVWVDFRLAVIFFVVAPLILLLASLASSVQSQARDDEVLRVVSGYWQAGSLLLITVLLNLDGLQLGAVTGISAHVMLAISLWFWEDLNKAIAEKGGALASAFEVWRLASSVVALLGAAAQVTNLRCALVASPLASDAACAAWLEPPMAFRELLLPGLSGELCGHLGMAALSIFVAYLVYFVAVALPQIGRSGLAPRPFFTWLAPLQWLGFASRDRGQPPL